MNADKKNQLIERIKSIDGLEDEERSALLELLRTKKSYGLVWEDKPENVEEKMRNKVPVLVEDEGKSLTDAGPEAPNHVLIEGDNLEALTTLAFTHSGRIDVIYIDPPYNTGNKDFIYNDSFVDSENAYRHSMWLSFMDKRLRIAKKLLSDRGVIFISIDDNEQANLKLLCDEVFGESNFIALLPRITKSSGKTTDKIAMNHDYVFLICKNINECVIQGLPHDDEGFKYEDEYVKVRGKYKLNQTLDYDSLSYSESLDYPIEIDGLTLYPGGSKEKYLQRKAGKHKRADWAWRWSKELFEFGLKEGFIVLKRSKNGVRLYTKTYQNVSIESSPSGYKVILKERRKPIQSIELINSYFSNDNAKKELAAIFENVPFDYPKPTSIMRYLLPTIPNCLYVLDFFAGSGTTLHAVMQLNAEDGDRRKCILVTNNENGICEEVTYERNKRVIEGYTNSKGDFVEGLKDNNLRYYKTELLDKDNSHANRRALFMALTDVLCFKEDIYHEEFQFGDLNLSGKSKMLRYFAEGDRKMLIIYDSRVIKFIVNEISKQERTENLLKVFIYADGVYPYTEDFQDVLDRIELIPMPYAFTHAIKGCIPEPKEQRVDQTELSEEEQQELLTEATKAENKNN